MVQREPMDLAAYVRRSTRGPCFVCATVAGDPDYEHEIVYEDEAHIAFLLSLGSQQGNSHLHWHIVPLPPGVPYEQQQYHALMAENGIIPWSPAQAAELAGELRATLAASVGR